ncbi:MAG: hypothetical protein Q7T83_12690 [Thermodesulfovibrionales bacterium]|nr:hypothetical protein [Thermodesulfovibrionales bacterium]
MKNKDELRGAITALIASLPIAILFVVVYRFPIPFVGNMHGSQYIHLVPIAWIFYGILGGFVVLFLGGALIGKIVGRKIADDNDKKFIIVICATIFATCAVAFLSVLDKIIGPW